MSDIVGKKIFFSPEEVATAEGDPLLALIKLIRERVMEVILTEHHGGRFSTEDVFVEQFSITDPPARRYGDKLIEVIYGFSSGGRWRHTLHVVFSKSEPSWKLYTQYRRAIPPNK